MKGTMVGFNSAVKGSSFIFERCKGNKGWSLFRPYLGRVVGEGRQIAKLRAINFFVSRFNKSQQFYF